MSLLRRRLRMPGPQRTIVGQWQRALLLRQSKLRDRIVDGVSPSVWDRDALGVVQATFEIAVLRYFRPPPDEHELSGWVAELRDAFGQQPTPDDSDMAALIRVTLGESNVAIDHIDTGTRLNIHCFVLWMITKKLDMSEPAIDDLILEGERTAFQRDWKPALADR
jgi:hypothetical protein